MTSSQSLCCSHTHQIIKALCLLELLFHSQSFNAAVCTNILLRLERSDKLYRPIRRGGGAKLHQLMSRSDKESKSSHMTKPTSLYDKQSMNKAEKRIDQSEEEAGLSNTN